MKMEKKKKKVPNFVQSPSENVRIWDFSGNNIVGCLAPTCAVQGYTVNLSYRHGIGKLPIVGRKSTEFMGIIAYKP